MQESLKELGDLILKKRKANLVTDDEWIDAVVNMAIIETNLKGAKL
jgi:hypothetical protein